MRKSLQHNGSGLCSVVVAMIIFGWSNGSHALEIEFNFAGSTLAKNVFGAVVPNGSPIPTSTWGGAGNSAYQDFGFKLVSTSGTVAFDKFGVQMRITVPGGIPTGNLNVSFFSGPIVSAPNVSTWIGTYSLPYNSVPSFDNNIFLSPGTFSPNMTATPNPGSEYFARVWSTTATGSQWVFKYESNANITYSGNVGVNIYNWTGSSYSTTAAGSFVPVPEPSTYVLGALGTAAIAYVARRRKALAAA